MSFKNQNAFVNIVFFFLGSSVTEFIAQNAIVNLILYFCILVILFTILFEFLQVVVEQGNASFDLETVCNKSCWSTRFRTVPT